jgi:hypothetical protein
MGPQYVHHALIGFGTRPVLLKFEDVLQRRDRNGVGLDFASIWILLKECDRMILGAEHLEFRHGASSFHRHA